MRPDTINQIRKPFDVAGIVQSAKKGSATCYHNLNTNWFDSLKNPCSYI
jgi:hypothetical protein